MSLPISPHLASEIRIWLIQSDMARKGRRRFFAKIPHLSTALMRGSAKLWFFSRKKNPSGLYMSLTADSFWWIHVESPFLSWTQSFNQCLLMREPLEALPKNNILVYHWPSFDQMRKFPHPCAVTFHRCNVKISCKLSFSSIWSMIRFAWLPIIFSRWKTFQWPPTLNIQIAF